MKNYMKLMLCFALAALGNSALIKAMEKEKTVEKSYLNKALLEAAGNGNITKAEELLRAGADVNATDNYGRTPLHQAVRLGNFFNENLSVATFLLAKGAKVNAIDKTGRTPLHLAVFNNNLAMVKFLVNQGANVNASNYNGDTPLHLAARYGSPEMVELLLDRGANINARDKNGNYPSNIAFAFRSYKILDLLEKARIEGKVGADELKIVMGLIKDLAPALYDAIVAVDPTGAAHIKRSDKAGSNNVSVSPSKEDGLPVIYLGSETNQWTVEAKRFVIAHELGHYALGHFLFKPIITHKVLEKAPQEKRVLKIGKKSIEIGGKLPFEESFKHAFTREQEFEADRFAVLEFGIPIDAETIAKLFRLKPGEQLETFKRSHPLAEARIKQLEDLRREVELYQTQKRQPTPIDWNNLAMHYLEHGE